VSGQQFAILLMIGAAALALWILWRYASFGPKTLFWALAHVVLACVVLRMLPLAFPSPGSAATSLRLYVEVFALALPALVYAFLSGGWVARIAVGLLKP
jgi:hypothetical protein